MEIQTFETAHLLALVPEIIVVVLAAVVMGLDLTLPESRRRQLGLVTAVGLFAAMAAGLIFSQPNNALIFGGMIRNDSAAFLFRMLFMFSGAITALLSLDVEGLGRKGEYYAILLGSVLGMNFMAAAADLIMLYLALETTSIGLYALAGFLRDDDKSAESGLKYFLFGALTSTVMLYGFSLLFGYTGQTNLYAIAEAIGAGKIPILPLIVSAVLIVVGLGFKVAIVPFHFWTPDVYEGAPTPVTAFLSVASKSAGFAALIRVFMAGLPGIASAALGTGWLPMLMAMSAVTMTVGNLLALPQRNIKRLLAYSSIAHAGYAMMGIVAFTQQGVAATVLYLMAYVLTNLAAFGVVILFARAAGSDEIADYAGLSRRSPGLAMAMLVAFLSLGGMPPLVGFVSKFFVFAAAMQAGLVWLTFLGVINSIIGLYYYLIVLKMVYVKPAPEGASAIPVPRAYAFALGLLCFGILLVGIVVTPLLNWATTAASTLF
ncbi:MAG: NADH-quinone oxidoreductase subunit N [Chloroflexi bacterium]|nr:NADH-quinone oxidoreductase subunit N [Chloroflexota bacterium]